MQNPDIRIPMPTSKQNMLNWLKKTFLTHPKLLQVNVSTEPANGSVTQTEQSNKSITCKTRGDEYLEQGKLADATECYQQAVSINPGNAEAHCSLGIVFFQQDLLEDAERHLKQAILIDSKMAKACYFLGATALKQGKLNESIENLNKALELKPDAEIIYRDLCYALFQSGQIETAKKVVIKGIGLNPDFADFHSFLGNLYYHEKELDKAIASYQKTLSIQPDYAAVHANLGRIFQDRGNLDEAIDSYRKVLELRPDYVDLHFDLGELLQKQGKLDDALACYQKALALNPGLAKAQVSLGNTFKEQGRPDEAIACYRKALALKPDAPEVHYNLGVTFKAQGKLDEAIACYRKALALKPDFAEAHSNLGNVFLEQCKLNEAVACYNKALAINPDLVDTYSNLGIAFVEQGKRNEAVSCFRRVLELDPEHYTAQANMLHQLQHMCEWKDFESNIQAVRRAVFEVPSSARNRIDPFVFMALPGTTAEEQKRCAEKWVKSVFQPAVSLRNKLGFEFRRTPNNKISVGYLSADFRQHPVSFLMAEVFELHDRSRFHISAYAYDTDGSSAMRERLEMAFDNFVDIRNDSCEEAAMKIYQDHIDILVDLTGYTQNNRSKILALRPVPIQVNYLGYPGTMGADFVDYLIADRFTVPPEKRNQYTENVVWLPDCFQANDRSRIRPASPGRKACGLPEEVVVLCCFNQTLKITPEMFDIWCRLLKAAPGSILWLPASTPQVEGNLRRETENRGVEAGRLIMAPLLDREKHLARLQCADLFLDTLPFNAGTTCSDALWMGLPVVTCAGDAFISRMAGSLLSAINVPELITFNLEDYYNLALDLVMNEEKREGIRNKIIANRDTAPLFDSERFTRNLEAAYTKMMSELRMA